MIQALPVAAAALSFIKRVADDSLHEDVAAEETRTAGAVRIQALSRGVVARRVLRAAMSAATEVQACASARAAKHEASCCFTSAATVRVQPAALVVVQALWRGVMSREALFYKTIAAVIIQR